MRATPVLLAALLVCAAVGASALPAADRGASSLDAAATATPAATTATANATSSLNETGTIRILSLGANGSVAAGIDVVSIDAGTATSFGANASAARIRTIALRERITDANTSDERQKRILDGLNEVEKDLITLHTRQREALAAYASGDLTAKELLVELGRIRATASVLTDRVELMGQLAADTDEFTLDDNRVFPLLYDLRTFDGPVRSRTVAALNGEERASTRVYVAATAESVTLSTIDDGQYVREAFRGDLRERDGSGINEEVAQNVTAQSYPEIWAATGGSISGQGSGGTFQFDLRYPNGTLTAFVGGGSEQVFLEHHRMDLDGVETGAAATRTLDLTVHVNRTFPGGPLRINVTEPNSDDPVNAVVKVGREGSESPEIGTTGDDGVLWTVSPRGEFVVTVIEVGSTDISTIRVTPTEPQTVADALASNGSARVDPPT
ncbi:DUF7096 domain-containing protein [Halobaculum limi]|uniref:DUF7096 domain-containing protein n=1 Tax=Halobaculum limi TaxID=3031916 RepID=UPI0024065A30|nr:hypothetical protein [Halobaculum sp. YSMS11]